MPCASSDCPTLTLALQNEWPDIGQALAESFAAQGDHVIRVDRERSSKRNDSLASTSFFSADLASEEAISRLWRDILTE